MFNWNYQSHHNKQLLLLFFLSMKTLCLSYFVGYRRSILYTFEISFAQISFFFYFSYVLPSDVFFTHTKILNFMFPHFENIMHHSSWKIWTFWRRIRSLLFTRRSLLSSSCVDYLWVVRSVAESPCSLYIVMWRYVYHKNPIIA